MSSLCVCVWCVGHMNFCCSFPDVREMSCCDGFSSTTTRASDQSWTGIMHIWIDGKTVLLFVFDICVCVWFGPLFSLHRWRVECVLGAVLCVNVKWHRAFSKCEEEWRCMSLLHGVHRHHMVVMYGWNIVQCVFQLKFCNNKKTTSNSKWKTRQAHKFL